MDVKSAYLQAMGFSNDIYIYVSPLRKEKDSNDLWKLLIPAYDLTKYGCGWYSISNEALIQDFGLNRFRYDPLLYYYDEQDEAPVLFVQVDDYLYTRTTFI